MAAQRAMRDKGCEVTHFPAVLDTLDSIAGNGHYYVEAVNFFGATA